MGKMKLSKDPGRPGRLVEEMGGVEEHEEDL